MTSPSTAPQRTNEFTARQLAEDPQLGVKLRLVAGAAGLDRPIRHPRVQKSGLALAGHAFGVVPTRIQVLGETELSYLDSLTIEGRGLAARGFFALGLTGVVLTRAGDPARALSQAAEASGTPLFVSDSRSSRTINALHALLDDRLAPVTKLHGVLVDVYGVGLLLLGKSGIGKSECALELVLRGHRLVADDMVRCEWRPPGMVFGSPEDLLRHHLEIRGLGILNVKALFGVTSVSERKRIDVVVRLVDWDDKAEYDRLGLEEKHLSLLGTPIRELTVPVRPGRDMGTILEIAARNELLRRAGTHSARDFLAKIEGGDGTRLAFETGQHRPPWAGEAPPYIDPLPADRESAPESVVPAPLSSPIAAQQPEEQRTGESSAWIPAVRIDPPTPRGGK